MIRYRTETIKIREMTYLFVVMGLSIVNGMALSTSYAELLLVNLLTVLIIWILDGTKLLKHTATKIILYDRIENTKHGKEEDLKADLIERTGLDISKVEVGHIDYLRDVAYVKVYYKPIDGEVNTMERSNSRSMRSWMTSRWRRPRKPHLKPKPRADDESFS